MAAWAGDDPPYRGEAIVNLADYPGLEEVRRQWAEFERARHLVREGKACFLLRWHAFTFGPGTGDDRYPVLGKVVDASTPVEGH